MKLHSLASRGAAALLYVAYATLPIGLALLVAGLLNADASQGQHTAISTKSLTPSGVVTHPTPLSVPATDLSPRTHEAWARSADAERTGTSSAHHARREADRTANEPPGTR